MFDVVWADPERELVGQRKARKALAKKEDEIRNGGGGSAAPAKSGISNPSKRIPSFLESLRSRKTKSKLGTASGMPNSRLSTCSGSAGNRESFVLPPNLPESLRETESIQSGEDSLHPHLFFESSDSSQARSSQDDSILSKWTAPISISTMLSLDEEIEKAANSSGLSFGSGDKSAEARIEEHTRTAGRPIGPSQLSPMPPPLSLRKSYRLSQTTSDAGPGNPSTPLRSPSGRSILWRPPESWKCSELPAGTMVDPESRSASSCFAADSITQSQDDDSLALSLDLSGIQREVLQMAAASQEMYLQRLTEEWGPCSDSALYKELEMEKKRWVLSALYSLSPMPDTCSAKMTAGRRILAFFETHATASYIAALNAGVPVHHMSPSPLLSRLFPNVSPIFCSVIPRIPVSIASHTFSDIYAQSLPVRVASNDMPQVLRSMHRILKPQGTLHLVLMDPLPSQPTMGPYMRLWLEKHLLSNLERQSKCTSPTTAFVTWLRNAHFQLREEFRVVGTFYAFAQTENRAEMGAANGDACKEAGQRECQLRSLVGQKMWQEIWGPCVTADRWWWEDAVCREECLRLGTTWEYHLVDVMKKGSAPGGAAGDIR